MNYDWLETIYLYNLTQPDYSAAPWRHHPWHPGVQATPNWSRPEICPELVKHNDVNEEITGGKNTEHPDVWVCVCVTSE